VPSADAVSFFATVTLLNGLRTTSNKILIYRNGMTASAEIVTEDLTLMERFFITLRELSVQGEVENTLIQKSHS